MMCNIDKSTLLRTKQFAEKYHGNQMYGDFPYISHLMDVLIICTNYHFEIQQLALLHDVIEDTKATEEIVSKEFGASVGKMCSLISDEPGANRKIKKELTYKKLTTLDEEDYDEVKVLIVKAADRLANMLNCIKTNNRGLIKMYIKEFPEFKKAVYREGICEEIWGRLFTLYDMYK